MIARSCRRTAGNKRLDTLRNLIGGYGGIGMGKLRFEETLVTESYPTQLQRWRVTSASPA